jgi:APA family basic amino acid/polyamine antiporter
LKALFHRKTVDTIIRESEASETRLNRVLGSFDVTMIGIGAVIGAGIFTMVGEAAVGASSGYPAGPALILSFVLTAIACGFAALCYAEMAAMVPIAGSAYTYTYATLGEFCAWIIGWDLIIEYAIGNVAVAISWSGYFNDFLKNWFGLDIPLWARLDYRTFVQKGMDVASAPHVFGVPIVFNLPAVCIVAALTWLLVRGIRESTRFNGLMVIMNLSILALFVGIGFYYFNPDHWVPFAPGGFKGIQVGAAIVFFAYIGFDSVSTVAEETKNPARDMPIGIIGSLIVCTIIYILVTAALTGMIPFAGLKEKVGEPLVAGLQYNNVSGWIVGMVALGAIISQTAVLLVFQMGQPRIFFSMSRDGLLPANFRKIHPKYHTPHVTTIWTGVAVATLAAFCNIDEMAKLCNIGTLFAFMLVCFGVMVLRWTEPDRKRPFKVPFVNVVGTLGIAFCLFLMAGLDAMTWMRFFAWMAIGIAIYFLYGFRNSRVQEAKR